MVLARTETEAHLSRLTGSHPDVLLMERAGRAAVRVGDQADIDNTLFRRIKVVRYFVPHRPRMTEIVQPDFKKGKLPLLFGHVEVDAGLQLSGGGLAIPPELTARLYASDTGVHAVARITHDPNTPFGSSDRACYRTAHAVGLGNDWAESLYTLADKGQDRFNIEAIFTPAQVEQLNETLEKY